MKMRREQFIIGLKQCLGMAVITLLASSATTSSNQEHLNRERVIFQEDWESCKTGAVPGSPCKTHGVEKGNSVTVREAPKEFEAKLGNKVLLIDDVLSEKLPPPNWYNAGFSIKLPKPCKGPLLLEFDCSMSGSWSPSVHVQDPRYKCGVLLLFSYSSEHVRSIIYNRADQMDVAFCKPKTWLHVQMILPELATGSRSTYRITVTRPDGKTISVNQLAFVTDIKEYGYIYFGGYSQSQASGQFYLDNIRITKLK